MHTFIKIIKKVKIKNMLILILLILFNAYAWFIYATRVSTDITAHVSSWNVEFVGDDVEKTVEVHNKGETPAVLDYEIKELKVMGETFTVDEENGPTTQDMITKMNTEYPFKINIEKDDKQLSEGTGNGKFIISLDWNFESGDDEADTIWGNKAYEFYELHPDENSIELKLTLIATQSAE